ncbi:AraC family transcriptional regulator [Propionispora sp. 2/2-37]|uniref:AraC family transcriptional regulator n=1 Tax=Propionispora sp. 2/2-37 TaxID=1677858 RepID=UPI0006BB775E|nr:AraC family transcriptional regulator [Propionispora sp. 2/2-37]
MNVNVDINELASYYANIHVTFIDIVRVVMPPGRRNFGAHTPPVSGLIFPLRGRARMVFDGVSYEMEYGKIFYAGPNMSLEKEVMGESEWEFMVIHYRAVGEDKGVLPYGLAHFQLETGYNTHINDLLQRLHNCCTKPGSIPELKAKSLFFTILNEILMSAGNRRNDSGQKIVEQAVAYINSYYMEPLTVPQIAAQYGLTSKQFAYLFQKYTAMGPNEYLITCRVRRARELLCSTECSVAEISACVGYSDPYYFSKLFKKRTGFSPSTLQRCLGKKQLK